MKKEDLLKLAEDDRFISGIYNYCDRWCERCPFTSRCMNFAMGKNASPDREEHDSRNEAFWKDLTETFEATRELLKDLADREGIDLETLDVDGQAKEDALDEELARNHKCCRMATTYSKMVSKWFDAVEAFSEEEEDPPVAGPVQELSAEDPLGLKASCHEALEVVRWYQHQIYIKLMRAVRGTLREADEVFDGFAKDSDGSAKVALIGIERSIGAWGELRPFFVTHDAEIRDILIHLEGLRRQVEQTFPAARDFIRPGFDSVELNG